MTVVLATSILLQLAAAFLALRLIRITGRRTAWVLIAVAIFLMGARRCITMFRLLSGELAYPPDLSAELVALAIFTLMVVGIAWIAPFSPSIRRSEEALQRSEEYFRSLTKNISDATAVINADGTLHYISPSSEKVFGYRQEEVARRSAFDFVHPDDQPYVTDVYNWGIQIPGYTAHLT